MSRIKLKSIDFGTPAFRKLGSLSIDFADRITVIAGHNGIGKSTILGLIANSSGLSSGDYKSYFNGNAYQGNINEILHLDPVRDYKDYEGKEPATTVSFDVNGDVLAKRADLTRRSTGSIRVVPRNVPLREFSAGGVIVKDSSKVPLPTLYLGMTRVLPVGESSPTAVITSADSSMDPLDADFIRTFVNSVIAFEADDSEKSVITTQGIKGTKKTSKHPGYAFNSRCVSLGQDNLSAIATAFASFQKLKREWAEYPGGLLVVDEIDAGLHPFAQQKLVAAMTKAAKSLSLQIVVTTHSLTFIECIADDSPAGARKVFPDKVVYLTDTARPRVADYSLEEISDDMKLKHRPKIRVKTRTIKAYLEDAEAEFFFRRLLTASLKAKIKDAAGARLQIIGLGAGGENLKGFVKKDPYFKTTLIVLDGDTRVPDRSPNILSLPGGDSATGDLGLSPERTLHGFLTDIVLTPGSHLVAMASLKDLKTSTDYVREKLLSGVINITDRVSAKAWMKTHLSDIRSMKLFEIWAAENPSKVQAFEKALLAAAVATSKLAP